MCKTGKDMQSTFFVKLKNLGQSDDHMQRGRKEIEVGWVCLYGILKYMGRFVVKLKVIKYKKDFFYYLSSHPDLGL